MTKTINCEKCDAEFTYEENPKYPRKYCLNCSAEKKKQWNEAKQEPTASAETEVTWDKPVNVTKPSKEFHLSPEQVRTNAVDLHLKTAKRDEIDWKLVYQIEEYLWNGAK